LSEAFAYEVADRISALAKEHGRSPLIVAVQILIKMNPEALQEWAASGFPTTAEKIG